MQTKWMSSKMNEHSVTVNGVGILLPDAKCWGSALIFRIGVKSAALIDLVSEWINAILETEWTTPIVNEWLKTLSFTFSLSSAVNTCCSIGRMYFSGSGENLFCLRKSYRFCSSISNTRQVCERCWKHSYARTKLNSSADSCERRERIDTCGEGEDGGLDSEK